MLKAAPDNNFDPDCNEDNMVLQDCDDLAIDEIEEWDGFEEEEEEIQIQEAVPDNTCPVCGLDLSTLDTMVRWRKLIVLNKHGTLKTRKLISMVGILFIITLDSRCTREPLLGRPIPSTSARITTGAKCRAAFNSDWSFLINSWNNTIRALPHSKYYTS